MVCPSSTEVYDIQKLAFFSTEVLKVPSNTILTWPCPNLCSRLSPSRPKTLYYFNFTSNTYISDVKCLSGPEVWTTRGGTVQHFPFTITERPSPCRTIADIPTTPTRSVSIRAARLQKKHDQELPTTTVLDHHSEIGFRRAGMIEAKVSDMKQKEVDMTPTSLVNHHQTIWFPRRYGRQV